MAERVINTILQTILKHFELLESIYHEACKRKGVAEDRVSKFLKETLYPRELDRVSKVI